MFIIMTTGQLYHPFIMYHHMFDFMPPNLLFRNDKHSFQKICIQVTECMNCLINLFFKWVVSKAKQNLNY